MTVLERSQKQQFTILELEYGSSKLPNPAVAPVSPIIDDTPTIVRLTDNTSDVTVEGEVYSSVPEMEFKLAAKTGTLEERPNEVILPESVIDSEMVSGPFAPVDVRIKSVVREDVDEEISFLHVGKLHRTIRNYRGRDGQCLLQCVSWKQLLRVRPGMIATHQCQWSLWGKGCVMHGTAEYQGANNGGLPNSQQPTPTLASAINYADILSISGQEITARVDHETSLGKAWHAGFFEYRGLRLKIIDWDEVYSNISGGRADTTLVVEEAPPASWDGVRLRLLPGCDKFVETCDLYQNRPNFGGVGYAILSYNPMIENGA